MATRPGAVPRPRGSYRTPAFEHANVSDAMRPGVISCPADTSLRSVAQMMAQQHIHSVVVTDLLRSGAEDGAWGVVSDIDLLRAVGEDVDERTAGDVAGTELPTVTPDDRLARAAQLMAEHEVTHLLVVTPSTGAPLGVLSSLDVAGVVAWGEG
jgi:CBS domain-containing protein